MYYYEITIYLVGTTEPNTFRIDETELLQFLRFITDHVNDLHIFNVIRHTISQ